MAPRLTATLLLLALLSACSASRVVRLDMGQEQPLIHIPRTGESRPVELEEEEFTQAIAKEARNLATSLFGASRGREKYGKVMGKNAARAFALLLTVAIGQTASGFSAKVSTLPGSVRASTVGAPQARIQLTQVGQAQAVAVTTDKWDKATHSGGPWTPRFRDLFARAGMSLNDSANKVRVRGHKGSHPEEYHQEVFDRLSEAMQGCRNVQQCGEALTGALQRLGRLVSTPGTRLNEAGDRGCTGLGVPPCQSGISG